MFRLQSGRCFYCGLPMRKVKFTEDQRPLPLSMQGYTRDHFYPKALGYTLENGKVLAHEACNAAKGDRLPTAGELARYHAMFAADRI